MNKKLLFFCILFLIAGLGGCKKDKPADAPDDAPKTTDLEVPEMLDAPGTSDDKDKPKESQSSEGILKEIESKDPELADIVAKMLEEADKKVQKTCPVEGGAIKKDIFIEYQGKKVYFCCEACKAKFKADPQKYLPKLPQFKK